MISVIQSTLMGFGVHFPYLYLLLGYVGSLGLSPAVQAFKRVGESYRIIVSRISEYLINSFLGFFPVKK